MSEHIHAHEIFSGPHDCSTFLSVGGRVCFKNISGHAMEFGTSGVKVFHGQHIAICLDSKGVSQAINSKKVIVHEINEGKETYSLAKLQEKAITELELKEKSPKKAKSKSEETDVSTKEDVAVASESFATVAPVEQEPSVQLSSTEANMDKEEN